MAEVSSELRGKKRKRKENKHFRWSDEMHSSLNECLRSYKVSCEFTNTDLSSMQTFLNGAHTDTIKLSKTPSIKKVCLFFGGIHFDLFIQFGNWRVEVGHFKTYASCLPGNSVSYKLSVFSTRQGE